MSLLLLLFSKMSKISPVIISGLLFHNAYSL